MSKYCRIHFRITEKDRAVLFEKMKRNGFKNYSDYFRHLVEVADEYDPNIDPENLESLLKRVNDLTTHLKNLERFLNGFQGLNVDSISETLSDNIEDNLQNFFEPMDKSFSKLFNLTKKNLFISRYMINLFYSFVLNFFLEKDDILVNSWKESVNSVEKITSEIHEKDLQSE